MYRPTTKYKFVKGSIILTPILAFFVLFTGGGGHGTDLFARIIYPYTTAIIYLFKVETPLLEDMIFFGGLSLYIIYGLILSYSEKVGKLKLASYIIGVCHMIFVSLSFMLM